MASPPIVLGSADAPVILDPAQIIVEVGWGSRYIATRIDIGLNVQATRDDSGTLQPPEPEGAAFESLTQATPFYDPELGAMKSPHIFSGGQWMAIESDEVVYSGVPAVPGPFNYSFWEHVGIGSTFMFSPFARFVQGTEVGPIFPVGIPGNTSLKFTSGTDAGYEIRANAFSGGPSDGSNTLGDTGYYKWALGVDHGGADSVPVIEDESINLSGMTLTYRDKTYNLVGTKCKPGTGILVGEFWGLFEKAPDP